MCKIAPHVPPRGERWFTGEWTAEYDKDHAVDAATKFEQEFTANYPKASACLTKNLTELMTFHGFPAEHWRHIRSTNTIEIKLRHGERKTDV